MPGESGKDLRGMLRYGAGGVDRLSTALRVPGGCPSLRRPAPSVTASRHAASERAADIGYCAHAPAAFVGDRIHRCEILFSGSDRGRSGCACRHSGAGGKLQNAEFGIVYEKPPVIPVQKELYNTLSTFLTETKQQGQSSFGTFKDSEVFHLLVFLFRMGLMRSNGRPCSRRFIGFLRGQFPGAQELKKKSRGLLYRRGLAGAKVLLMEFF